ncbi:histidine kinase [Massilia sp. WF1]|uniref:flagellar motor protein MotB n=1 Tax=unclassified Massilia TaxID=2609279 RepID=UPI00064A38A0|nr:MULTISPECIES: flagellar motor protein MotB [unclassified Massilia]ALK96045.1 histidine kinase [Massilia sp. WG5]KLU37373.1 histidine kinase [Massilia sp. WF1]
MQADKKGDKHNGDTIIKRGGGRHYDDEHGGAWKVAFADFCMALMALFLVLWLIAARDAQTAKNIVRDNAASGLIEGSGGKPEIAGNPSGSMIERFQLPRSNGGSEGPSTGAPQNIRQGAQDGAKETVRAKYESASELAALAHALEQMSADAGLSSNLATVITPNGLRVMLHDTDRQGMFVRGSPLPTARFAKLLRAMAPLFEKMENQMLIVGHTDSLQYTRKGPLSLSNESLSVNRALAARSELLIGGMRNESILQVVGMADRAPFDAAKPDAPVNRRIELLILTSSQAASMATMFGSPGPTESLGKEVSISKPGDEALKELRSQMAKKP